MRIQLSHYLSDPQLIQSAYLPKPNHEGGRSVYLPSLTMISTTSLIIFTAFLYLVILAILLYLALRTLEVLD